MVAAVLTCEPCTHCRAFGNSVQSIVLSSLTTPSWAIILAWTFAVVQVVGTTQVQLAHLPRLHNTHLSPLSPHPLKP